MTVRRYRVVGRVQGVGYRWFVREAAREARLRGWVRNEADGAVTIEAAGPPGSLDQFLLALEAGPTHASVTNVHVTEIVDAVDIPSSFEIRR